VQLADVVQSRSQFVTVEVSAVILIFVLERRLQYAHGVKLHVRHKRTNERTDGQTDKETNGQTTGIEYGAFQP